MPRIDTERPGYLPDPPERKPSSDQAFYHSPAWRKMRRIHLTGNPLCAACEARGLLTDCTRYRIGAIDHIVAIGAGGAGQMTQQIRTKLVDIQRGAAADTHGWVQRID